MCSVAGNIIPYEGTLILRERNRKDSKFDEVIDIIDLKNQWRYPLTFTNRIL